MAPLELSPERQRLVDGLARLIARRGHEPFFTHPLVLPTEAYFPEPIPRTVGELRRLLSTLMTYAGLHGLAVEVRLFDSKDVYRIVGDDGREYAPPHAGAAAFFAGIKDDVCHFGLDLQVIEDPELLLGALAHEVAHAYRSFHRLEAMDHQIEEQLTDLTTVYLGFGALIASAAYDVRTSGRIEGSRVTHRLSVRRAGYLAPEHLVFLLAVQIVLRGDSADVRRIADELPSFQKDYLRSEFKLLAPASRELATLVLGDMAALANAPPRAIDHSMVLRNRPRLPPADSDDIRLDQKKRSPTEEQAASQQHTFRIGSSWRWVGALLGSSVMLFPLTWWHLPLWSVLVGGIAGYLVGRLIRTFNCTDRDCNARMSKTTAICPGCKREVRRTIRHINEKLDD